MENKEERIEDFNEDAFYIVELIQTCIEQFGFNDEIRECINEFMEEEYASVPYSDDVKTKIASVYMAFLGKTNVSNKNDPKNTKLHEGLLYELDSIRNLLSEGR